MKQFLYLDTDIVNSIIAQSEKGLITEISSQQESGKSKRRVACLEQRLTLTSAVLYGNLQKQKPVCLLGVIGAMINLSNLHHVK